VKRVVGLIAFCIFSGGFPSFGENLGYPSALDKELLKSARTAMDSAPTPPVAEASASGGIDELSPSGVLEPRLFQQTFRLSYSNSNRIKSQLKELYPTLSVVSDPTAKTVTVVGQKSILADIRLLLKRWDLRPSNIQVEVQVVEVHVADLKQYKPLLDAGNGIGVEYDFRKGQSQVHGGINVGIAGLIESGKARLIARPRIVLRENEQAHIQVGDQVPYVTTITNQSVSQTQVNYVNTGVDVLVSGSFETPSRIALDLTTTVSGVKIWKEYGDQSYPVVSSRKAQTRVSVPLKQSLIIAGLINESVTESEAGIPVLMGLPLIGEWFRGKHSEKEQTDIVFIITPEGYGA
jgi:general secretion pathway protein D